MAEITSEYLFTTPENAPTDYTCRRFVMPDDLEWKAIIYGALTMLLDENNLYEPSGHVTKEDVTTELLEIILTSFDGCEQGEVSDLIIGKAYYREPLNTPAGNLVNNTWTLREINTLDTQNTGGILSLGSNVVQFAEGLYWLEVKAAAYVNYRHKLRVVKYDHPEWTPREGNTCNPSTTALLSCLVDVQNGEGLYIEHNSAGSSQYGMGYPSNRGTYEQYLELTALRISDT